jgi:hypothetical protein
VNDETIDLEVVRAEIAEEVRQRRADGDFDAAKERELEQLFFQYAPMQGRVGALGEALRSVDATAFIDPRVPVESNQPAGAALKKAMRKAGFWYIEWITAQTTRALSGIARSLHLIDDEITDIRARLDLVTVAGSPVIGTASNASAWWAEAALAAFNGPSGRTLVAACADGWLVRSLVALGVDAYGIDSRPGRITAAEIAGLDLRDDDLLEHLSGVAEARLSGIVLTGTTEALLPAQRRNLVGRLDTVLASTCVAVIHSLHPDALDGDRIPAELDLAGGRPLRPSTWESLLTDRGFTVTTQRSPDDAEFVVVATRRGSASLR